MIIRLEGYYTTLLNREFLSDNPYLLDLKHVACVGEIYQKHVGTASKWAFTIIFSAGGELDLVYDDKASSDHAQLRIVNAWRESR